MSDEIDGILKDIETEVNQLGNEVRKLLTAKPNMTSSMISLSCLLIARREIVAYNATACVEPPPEIVALLESIDTVTTSFIHARVTRKLHANRPQG